MPLAQLMSQSQELPKIDKLELMQFLATELVKQEEFKNVTGSKIDVENKNCDGEIS